jgi:hypothetical protein
MLDQVVDFDACANLSADVGTVVKGDPTLLVDKQGEHPASTTSTPLQVDKTHAFRYQEGFHNLA